MTVYSTLEILAALKIPEIQKIFLEVMQDIVDNAILSEMIAAIESQDAERLFKATTFTPAALSPIIEAIEGVYKESAETVAAGTPKRIRTATGLSVFRFDMRNPTVENDLKTNSSILVQRLTEEARQNVRNQLQAGMIAGDNPRTTALNIVGRIDPITKKRVGGIIGLTENQEGWVRNTERYLKDLDPRYLKLGLRDKRFDSVFKKAMDEKKSLDAEKISKMVTRYKDNALKWRAENIARTETIQSLNRGEFASNMQLVDEGLVEREQMKKYWDDVGDRRVRHTHRALALKYGQGKGIPIDEPFISPSGAKLMYPGDISLGAPVQEIAMCRCRQKIKIDWLAGAD